MIDEGPSGCARFARSSSCTPLFLVQLLAIHHVHQRVAVAGIKQSSSGIQPVSFCMIHTTDEQRVLVA